MRWVLAFFCFQICYGDAALDEYFSYVKQIGKPEGSYLKGEIEVVLDAAEIAKIEKVQEGRLLKKGFSVEKAAEFSKVGIVSEDQYLIWLRDAVYFPKGVPGTYDRLIWKSSKLSGPAGVVVLPVLPDGKVVLNLNFRHATRSWELELPRGALRENETVEEGAVRELKEETGLGVASLQFLGNVMADSGILGNVGPVYMGLVSEEGKSEQEYSEAIADVVAFTVAEIKEGLMKGSMEVLLNGKKEHVPIRDAFLTFALMQAEIRKLL
jgi:ADP-ribose pyrophosphatase